MPSTEPGDDRALRFPFGEPLRDVRQTDRGPKRVFVLGVYASAVHARWRGPGVKISALAVASEPCIFWRGDGAEEIVRKISLPPGAGTLAPADQRLNGPSGRALDEHILRPLGLEDRQAVWLCDLVPRSCMNPRQREAITGRYMPLAEKLGLPTPTIPEVPAVLADDARREEILAELRESQAEVLITLGDEPLRWFLGPLTGRPTRLQAYQPYGQLHRMSVGSRELRVLPLVHPRQAGRLGTYSPTWFGAHRGWQHSIAGDVR